MFVLLSVSLVSCKNDTNTKYSEILTGEELVEGVGFPGIITVYNDLGKMYKLFGKPWENPEEPNTFYYHGGSFVFSYKTKKNILTNEPIIDMIGYCDDKNETIHTKRGIGIGDGFREVVETYGKEYEEIENIIKYNNLGVAFLLSDDKKVDEIVVFRINEPLLPPWHLPQPGKPKLTKKKFLGIEMGIPDDWKLAKESEEFSIVAFQDKAQHHNLTVSITPASRTAPEPENAFSLEQLHRFVSLVDKVKDIVQLQSWEHRSVS